MYPAPFRTAQYSIRLLHRTGGRLSLKRCLPRALVKGLLNAARRAPARASSVRRVLRAHTLPHPHPHPRLDLNPHLHSHPHSPTTHTPPGATPTPLRPTKAHPRPTKAHVQSHPRRAAVQHPRRHQHPGVPLPLRPTKAQPRPTNAHAHAQSTSGPPHFEKKCRRPPVPSGEGRTKPT